MALERLQDTAAVYRGASQSAGHRLGLSALASEAEELIRADGRNLH
jgi:hypothetical protein